MTKNITLNKEVPYKGSFDVIVAGGGVAGVAAAASAARRGKKVMLPRGHDVIMPGDSVIIVSKIKALRDISAILVAKSQATTGGSK